MENQIIVERKSFQIEMETQRYVSFADTLNLALAAIKTDLPKLHFEVDAAFLLEMIEGKVPTKSLAGGGLKYAQMLAESEIKAVYGNAGLELDMVTALKLYRLPVISPQLENAFASIYTVLDGEGLNLEFFSVENNQFSFNRAGKNYIERTYSLVLSDEDAQLWREYAKIADQLNELAAKYWDGRTVPIEYIFDKNNAGYSPSKTSVPSIFADFQNARVATQSMVGAPNGGYVNAPEGAVSF